jgi:hypothetical protein
MRRTPLAFIGSAIGFALALATCVSNLAAAGLDQPTSVKKAAYNDYLYFAPQDASNAPPAAAESKPQGEATAADTGTASACNAGCASCGEEATDCCCGLSIFKCNLGDPWKLPELCVLSERDIKVSGFIEAGGYTNQYDASTNGPLGTVDQKYFNMNQLWFTAEKATNTEEKDWDLGGRVDYMFGTDGPDTQCFGDHSWDWNWTSSFTSTGAPLYGSAMPQLYAEVAYKNLKVKAGHFYTPIGNEVVPAIGNFFYSHSYMMYYAEPFTHTGALATYKFNDKLSGSAGWSNAWDSGFDNKNEGSTFLGGLTLAATEKTTIAWYMCSGYFGTGLAYPGAATNDIFMNSLVITHKLTDRWTYIFQHDYATNYNRADDTSWYGINQYLTYKINDCWSFGGRLEWFRDDDGVRVIAGNAGNYYEMASGINYKPHANFLVRPELRYDWYNGSTAGGNPFNDGHATTQLSGGCDVIFTF